MKLFYLKVKLFPLIKNYVFDKAQTLKMHSEFKSKTHEKNHIFASESL